MLRDALADTRQEALLRLLRFNDKGENEMFRKECWVRYNAGCYGYKNGVTVKKDGKEWVVYINRVEWFRAFTLQDCKNWLGYKFD